MGNVRLDAAGVRALAQRVLDGADALDEIRWPTVDSVDLPGSAAGRAAAAPELAGPHRRRRCAHADVGGCGAVVDGGRAGGRRAPRCAPLAARVSRPSLGQAQAWRPEALRRLADSWDEVARIVHDRGSIAARSAKDWTGAGADASRGDAGTIAADGDAIARALVSAAVAARDGADQMAAAQSDLEAHVERAARRAFWSRTTVRSLRTAPPPTLLTLLSGNDPAVAARDARQPGGRMDPPDHRRAGALGRGRRRRRAGHPRSPRVGEPAPRRRTWATPTGCRGTCGSPPIALNIAQAIVDGLGDPTEQAPRPFYRGLLGEIDDPAGRRAASTADPGVRSRPRHAGRTQRRPRRRRPASRCWYPA